MEARQLASDARLWLAFGKRRVCISLDESAPLLIGRGEECQLVVDRPFVSRVHARVVRGGQDFFVVDESANGTFVRTEDERVTYVHRKRVRLWGSGFLSFGEPLSAASVVHFQHAD